MKINRIQNNSFQKQREKGNTISYKGGREVLRTFANPDSLMTTIFLESFVTGGRGISAYKRGGFPEFRERFTDDIVSAIFWMKGVDIFNKIGDNFGKHVLKLPTTNFDVGKDALRTPFENLVKDLGETIKDEQNVKSLEKKLATFKFTKIILSTILATGFVGFALPKINQAITDKLMSKNKNNQKEDKTSSFDETIAKQSSFDEFNKRITDKKGKNTSFKGVSPSTMTTIAHYLENNKICKMLTCDTGILSGRVVTARNPDEGIEYFFRDASSSFFYFASTPLVYKLLQKLSKSSSLTDIDPVCAKQINDKVLEQIRKLDGSSKPISVEEFSKKAIGTLTEEAKEIISKLPFSSDVISLDELNKYLPDENLKVKAAEMSKLQPVQAKLGRVLTKQQVSDIFKNGYISSPEFMQNLYKSKFGEDLTNPYKYIPYKKITAFRENIDKYLNKIIDTANKKNKGIIDRKLLDGINKKSYALSAGFRIIATAVSAFALGIAIPKIQYAITAKRTGSNEAPGLRKYSQKK